MRLAILTRSHVVVILNQGKQTTLRYFSRVQVSASCILYHILCNA